MKTNLSVPAVAASPDPEAIIRPAHLQTWIDGLPYANTHTLLQEVHSALAKLNQAPLTSSTRYKLLELYLQPYQHLMEQEQKRVPLHSTAALEKKRSETRTICKIAAQLTDGYKLVLKDSLNKKALWGTNKVVPWAIQRAMLFHSHVLLYSYCEYLPVPDNVWTEMAELFRLALTQKQGSLPPSHKKLGTAFQNSATHTYKCSLMVGLSDPYHLAQGELWKIFQLFDTHADLTQIAPCRPVDKSGGVFIIDPQSNQVPLAYAKVPPEKLPANGYLLRTVSAYHALRNHLSKLKNDNKSPIRSRLENLSLVGRALRGLGTPPQRKTPRMTKDAQVQVAPGISRIYHLLGGTGTGLDAITTAPRTPSEQEREKQEDESIQVISVRSGELVEVKGAITHEQNKIDGGKRTKKDEGQHQGQYYSSDCWELANHSRHGIGLIKHNRPGFPISVVEVIGFQLSAEVSPKQKWVIGTVRWCMVDDEADSHIPPAKPEA